MKKHFAKLQGIMLNGSFWTSAVRDQDQDDYDQYQEQDDCDQDIQGGPTSVPGQP